MRRGEGEKGGGVEVRRRGRERRGKRGREGDERGVKRGVGGGEGG